MQYAVDCAETYGAVNMQYAVGFGEFVVIFDHHPSFSEQTNASHTRLFVKIVFPVFLVFLEHIT